MVDKETAGQQIPASLDPREVDFYSGLAETWWDRRGPFWPLHRLNELRIKYIIDQVRMYYSIDSHHCAPLSGLNCLDIGCGGGILSESLAHHGGIVHGIDVVDKNIRIAQAHARQNSHDIHYELVSVEKLATMGKQYELVFNMEVVEHVAELDEFLDSCCKLVKPGGLMFIATINRTWFSYIAAILGAEYILRWLPKGTHQWRRFQRPVDLKNQLLINEFDFIGESGVAVNPVTRTFSLVKNNWVNYMLVAKNSKNVTCFSQ